MVVGPLIMIVISARLTKLDYPHARSKSKNMEVQGPLNSQMGNKKHRRKGLINIYKIFLQKQTDTSMTLTNVETFMNKNLE